MNFNTRDQQAEPMQKWPAEFLAFQSDDDEGILPENYRADLKATTRDPFKG